MCQSAWTTRVSLKCPFLPILPTSSCCALCRTDMHENYYQHGVQKMNRHQFQLYLLWLELQRSCILPFCDGNWKQIIHSNLTCQIILSCEASCSTASSNKNSPRKTLNSSQPCVNMPTLLFLSLSPFTLSQKSEKDLIFADPFLSPPSPLLCLWNLCSAFIASVSHQSFFSVHRLCKPQLATRI